MPERIDSLEIRNPSDAALVASSRTQGPVVPGENRRGSPVVGVATRNDSIRPAPDPLPARIEPERPERPEPSGGNQPRRSRADRKADASPGLERVSGDPPGGAWVGAFRFGRRQSSAEERARSFIIAVSRIRDHPSNLDKRPWNRSRLHRIRGSPLFGHVLPRPHLP